MTAPAPRARLAPAPPIDENGNAIAAHVVMIAHYIRRLGEMPQREAQIARNVGAAIVMALHDKRLPD